MMLYTPTAGKAVAKEYEGQLKSAENKFKLTRN